jgi:acyl-CoA synthetase (AMP-forming)/AMP-acid ligase II
MMSGSANWNFAARLLSRLGTESHLIDATTGQTIPAPDVPAMVIGFAAGLLSAELRPGDRVLIACGISPASSIAYFGTMFAGLVAVPVNEKDLTTSGEAVYRKVGASAIWTDRGVACEWAKRDDFMLIKGTFDPLPVDAVPPAIKAENDLAVLMSTSGSTGLPRLVCVSHGNLVANTEAIIRSQALGSDERAMLILPVSYCFGASVLHTHLYQGGAVVFDSRFMFPDKVLIALASYGCTTFAGVPTVYNILLRRSNVRTTALPRLRRFLQAGGSLDPQSIAQMRDAVPSAEFFVMYGQTEATARISCLPPHRLTEKLGSVGLPLDNLSIRIVDEAGQEVADNAAGELWVGGKSVCAGYFGETDDSNEKFHNGWLRTGDVASRDVDGFIWIKGRRGDFIKMRGIRLGFAEIEAKISAISGVFECAATVVPHVEAGEALVLFVVASEGASDLINTIRRKMPREWICDAISLVKELPRTAHGKLARAELASMAHALPGQKDFALQPVAVARSGK